MTARDPELHPTPAPSRADTLLRGATQTLGRFAASLQPLHDALAEIDGLGNINAIKASAKIRRDLERFEPTVTMIGQIKSGKTTLVNAMIGIPDLLPADVNPWTSVVTSLHMSPRALTPPTRATFRFFDNSEWDRLVKGGGRIGDLASRAGSDDELSTILAQAEAMRQKARDRLGRKFELLLGETHDYGYFDQELVERYVCLGDAVPEQTSTGKTTGYFADITRSADLYMQRSGLPTNLCIRDTPGVNDTFMVREQITIKAIRDSRICVVVLSAGQALSTTDLALIRLISNVKSREVIIFINRIDELADPGPEVEMIRNSILKTLADHKGPEDATLIFGSALWAKTAALGNITDLPKASLETLYKWAEVTPVPHDENSDPQALIWQLSGLPALYETLGERIVDGEGREMVERNVASAVNLLNGIRASDNLDAKLQAGPFSLQTSPDQLSDDLDRVRQQAKDSFAQSFRMHCDSFFARIDRAQDSFLDRATEDLAKHLEIYGERSPWSYDPAGLRILLQSGYKIFGAKAQSAYTQATNDATSAFRQIFEQAFGLDPALYAPQVPAPPHIPAPVSIGQTIALDLRGSWWTGWWTRRQEYMTQAQRFQGLMRAETQQLLDDLKGEQVPLVQHAMSQQLDAFLDQQIANLNGMLADGQNGRAALGQVLDVDSLKARDTKINHWLRTLEEAVQNDG